MAKLPKIMSLEPQEEEENQTELYSENVLKDKDFIDKNELKYTNATLKNITLLDTGQENNVVDTNRSGTVGNTKVSESFDVNVNINLGGESNVNLQDNKSDAVQISDPNPDTKSIERDINNSISNTIPEENIEKPLTNKITESESNTNKMNESILSGSDTNKSKKKVTFQKYPTNDEIQDINTMPLNPTLDNESAAKPSDSLPNTPNESNINIDGKFNSNSGMNIEDELQIREDILENDCYSPVKNDNDNHMDTHGESLNFESSIDPSNFKTMDSTVFSNTMTTMVMDEDSEDDMLNMPNPGQFSQ